MKKKNDNSSDCSESKYYNKIESCKACKLKNSSSSSSSSSSSDANNAKNKKNNKNKGPGPDMSKINKMLKKYPIR